MPFNHLGISPPFLCVRRGPHHMYPYSVNLAYATTWIMSQRILIHVRGTYPDAQTKLNDDFMAPTESTRQSTVVVSAPSTMKISTPSERSEAQMKLESCVHGSLTTNLTDEDSHNPPSEFDIEVRIDRSILRDARQPHGERDLPALP